MKYDLSNEYQRGKAQEYLAKLCKGMTGGVEIRKIAKRRTLSQNRYYFALITIYGIETGWTRDEMHVNMKREYGLVYRKNESVYLRSTTTLDTKEMTDYIEFIRNHAGQNGVYLPDADELKQNWAYYDALIEQHKTITGETR